MTLGIGEPFTTTLGVSLLFAFILALPIILFELYGFLLPAFTPEQQRIAYSLVLAIPLLFAAGVAFGYFVVLPSALRFFQNFNSGEFNVLVQANQYYHFAAVVLLAMGLVFQVPVGILAATRSGIVTPRQLRHNRRYAILACGAVAAFLPGDAITLLLETVPLYLLFEASLLLASIAERRVQRRERSNAPPSSVLTHGINYASGNLVERAHELTEGRGAEAIRRRAAHERGNDGSPSAVPTPSRRAIPWVAHRHAAPLRPAAARDALLSREAPARVMRLVRTDPRPPRTSICSIHCRRARICRRRDAA